MGDEYKLDMWTPLAYHRDKTVVWSHETVLLDDDAVSSHSAVESD